MCSFSSPHPVLCVVHVCMCVACMCVARCCCVSCILKGIHLPMHKHVQMCVFHVFFLYCMSRSTGPGVEMDVSPHDSPIHHLRKTASKDSMAALVRPVNLVYASCSMMTEQCLGMTYCVLCVTHDVFMRLARIGLDLLGILEICQKSMYVFFLLPPPRVVCSACLYVLLVCVLLVAVAFLAFFK